MTIRPQRSCNHCGADLPNGMGISFKADEDCKNKPILTRLSFPAGSYISTSWDFCSLTCLTLYFTIKEKEVEGAEMEEEEKK
jgi:hypothetical protein